MAVQKKYSDECLETHSLQDQDTVWPFNCRILGSGAEIHINWKETHHHMQRTMAIPQHANPTKLAHVNMMTDTVIANLTPEALRSIMRSLLAAYPDLTAAFETSTRDFLHSTASLSATQGKSLDNAKFTALQARIRCMVGCGLCYQSLPLLRTLVDYIRHLNSSIDGDDNVVGETNKKIATIDADIVQAATAVQKTLTAEAGARDLSADEFLLVRGVYDSVVSCREDYSASNAKDLPFERGLMAMASLLGYSPPVETPTKPLENSKALPAPVQVKETFRLGSRQIPRIFSGLWQLSSPAWGSASAARIVDQFEKTVRNGLTAFDMADHYGDAEIIFV